MDEHDDDVRVALGVLFGVVLFVGALVIGVVMSLSGAFSAKPAQAAAVQVTETELVLVDIAPVGDALAKVYFEIGLAEVKVTESADALGKVVAAAQASAGSIVLLSGFHDASGDAAMNAELARNRAKAVREALKAAGVDGERIKLRKPEVTEGSGEPQEARRVEIRVQ